MSENTKKSAEALGDSIRPGTRYFPVQITASSLGALIPISIPTLRRSLAAQVEKEVTSNEDLELLDYGPDPKKPAFSIGKRPNK